MTPSPPKASHLTKSTNDSLLLVAAWIVDAPGYAPHQLRHARQRTLIAQGQRVEVVQRVLGHRDIRSTLSYAELRQTQVRVALDRRALR